MVNRIEDEWIPKDNTKPIELPKKYHKKIMVIKNTETEALMTMEVASIKLRVARQSLWAYLYELYPELKGKKCTFYPETFIITCE